MRQILTTAAQEKAMAYIAFDPQEWIQNAWDNRARQAIDEIILHTTDKQPQKVSAADKEAICLNADIKTAKVRQAEADALLKEQT